VGSPSPSIKIEYAIICDDIRREDNGKLIIIGVYGSDITVPVYPVSLSLGILIAVRSATDKLEPINFRVLQDGIQKLEIKDKLKMSLTVEGIALFSIGGLPIAAEKDAMFDFQVQFSLGRYRSICKAKLRKS